MARWGSPAGNSSRCAPPYTTGAPPVLPTLGNDTVMPPVAQARLLSALLSASRAPTLLTPPPGSFSTSCRCLYRPAIALVQAGQHPWTSATASCLPHPIPSLLHPAARALFLKYKLIMSITCLESFCFRMKFRILDVTCKAAHNSFLAWPSSLTSHHCPFSRTPHVHSTLQPNATT